MSVSHTADAVIDRRKTVTRRLGWRFLKAGDRLTLCRKVMGRRAGEPLERLAEVEVVDVRRELILAMSDADVAREGIGPYDERFDEWTAPTALPPATSFVSWWLETFAPAGFNPYVDDVTRIEWRYVEPCVFPGCVSTDRHYHGPFPGGHENPADPDDPPIPFTREPGPGVRDYNGAVLLTSVIDNPDGDR